MTESVSFSSASEVNPPASAAESISVNSRYEPSTGSDGVVNCEATNRGVDNSGTDEDGWEDDGRGFDDDDDTGGGTSFDTGMALIAQGFTIIPLDHPDNARCAGAHGPSNKCDGTRGKHPVGKWEKTACRTAEDLITQLSGAGPRNWGILTGVRSNLLVIDEDEIGAFADVCRAMDIGVPDTLRVGTGREGGGQHWWFRPPADAAITIGTGLGDRKLDWRCEGGMVIAPGSVHQTGAVYTVADSGGVIRPLPDRLVAALVSEPVRQAKRRKELKARAKELGVVGGAAMGDPSYLVGGRDNQVFSFCVWTRKAGIRLERAEELLYADWLKLEQPPYDTYPWDVALGKLHRVHGDENYAAEGDGEEEAEGLRVNPVTGEILSGDPDGGGGDLFAGQDQGNNVVVIPESEVSDPGGEGEAEGDEWPADRLPDAFWESTSQLQKIRQMARARRASPDAVLHAVLARTAAMADPTVRIDGGIRPATLCWYCGLYGPSGSGKGNAENTAEELAPFPAVDYAHIDISTGQGIIAAYLDPETDPEDEDGKKKIMVQKRTRGYALATEGNVLDAMAKTNAGGTLNTVLCSGWMSERQGTTNATVELRRALPKGAYTLSMSLGVQEEPAAKLLEMGNIGLPQRLAWAHAALGSDTPERRPETTGPLTVTLRNGEDVPVTTWVSGLRDIDLQVPGHVVKEIDQLILANSFGRGAEAPLDTHEPLWRLKCAALLALLHGRTDVRTEEWDLATELWETSRKVRSCVQDAAQKRLTDAAAAKRAETVQTAAESQAAVYEVLHGVHPSVVNVAKRAHRYLVNHGDEVTARDVNRNCIKKPDRDRYRASGATGSLWSAALEYACDQGWVAVLEGGLLALGAVSPD